MLTVYTSTFCRPDYVQLLADCLRATVAGDYRLVVYVQPGGLARQWRGVHDVVMQEKAGYHAWREIIPAIGPGPAVLLHDDCVPVLPWGERDFPAPNVIRLGGCTIQYHAAEYRQPAPLIMATRISSRSRCSAAWGSTLRDAVVAANCESLLDGRFIHIDKGTIGSLGCSANAAKPALVKAIATFVGVPVPEPLSEDEAAIHPGKNFKAAVRAGDAAPLRNLSLVRRAANLTASAARHVAAGMPRATDEEIERRFAICQGCEHFDGKACRQCGCPIVREKRFVSKLSWANEACPAGKW